MDRESLPTCLSLSVKLVNINANEMDSNIVPLQGLSARMMLLKVASESFLVPIPDLMNQNLGGWAHSELKDCLCFVKLVFPKLKKRNFIFLKIIDPSSCYIRSKWKYGEIC